MRGRGGTAHERHDGWQTALAGMLLVLAVLALYAPVAGHGFIALDDDRYVLDNPRVRAGLTGEGLIWAFRTFQLANWHPLTWLSHMLDVELWGLRPGPHHLTSVALHALTAWLLFLWLRRTTGALWRSLGASAFFALHPLRVESVAWIAERKDLLAGLFGLLSLLAFTSWVRARKRWAYILSVALLALGLMAKPSLVTWPLVLLLCDVWPFARWWSEPRWRLVLEKLPFFGLAVASSVITLFAQRAGGAVSDLAALSLGFRLANAAWAYAIYLLKSLVPVSLSVHYPHPALAGGTLEPLLWRGAFAAAGLAAITFAVIRMARRRPYLALGWLWFGGTLVPMIGLVQVGTQALADRYTYLPHIGLGIALAWTAGDWAASAGRGRLAIGAGLAVLLASGALLARSQLAVWRDSRTLFEHALGVSSDSAMIHTNLAAVLILEGDRSAAAKHCRAALAIDPTQARAHHNLAWIAETEGFIEQARAEYEHALRIDPTLVPALVNLGAIEGRLGLLERAESRFNAALAIDPELAAAHSNLGAILEQRGDHLAARARYERALAIDPEHLDARVHLAASLATAGRVEEAANHYRRALAVARDSAERETILRELRNLRAEDHGAGFSPD